MEKRILGIILTLLGAVGLIAAAYQFMGNAKGTHTVKGIITYLVLGAIFFTAGIGLIKNTKDKPS